MGTSLIGFQKVHGHLAHRKTPAPSYHLRAPSMDLMYGPVEGGGGYSRAQLLAARMGVWWCGRMCTSDAVTLFVHINLL